MYHKIDLTQSSINKVIDEYNYLLATLQGLVPPRPPLKPPLDYLLLKLMLSYLFSGCYLLF